MFIRLSFSLCFCFLYRAAKEKAAAKKKSTQKAAAKVSRGSVHDQTRPMCSWFKLIMVLRVVTVLSNTHSLSLSLCPLVTLVAITLSTQTHHCALI